ncbi:unnamed protein product, partial [marine sediment metagenome]
EPQAKLGYLLGTVGVLAGGLFIWGRKKKK